MSDNILSQIYRGDYCPLEKPFTSDREYEMMLARKTDMEDRFEAALPESMKSEFLEYLHISGELDRVDEESAFCEGVRLGVLLMNAVFTQGRK